MIANQDLHACGTLAFIIGDENTFLIYGASPTVDCHQDQSFSWNCTIAFFLSYRILSGSIMVGYYIYSLLFKYN